MFRTVVTCICLISGLISVNMTFAQACGEGEFRIEFFTKNGLELEPIKYKIYPTSAAKLAPFYANSAYGERLSLNLYHGTLINPTHAVQMIDSVGEEGLKDLKRYGKESKRKTEGVVRNGEITFHTWETYSKPYILKLWSKQKVIYVYATVFGGCNRTSFVLWNERPQIVRRD